MMSSATPLPSAENIIRFPAIRRDSPCRANIPAAVHSLDEAREKRENAIARIGSDLMLLSTLITDHEFYARLAIEDGIDNSIDLLMHVLERYRSAFENTLSKWEYSLDLDGVFPRAHD